MEEKTMCLQSALDPRLLCSGRGSQARGLDVCQARLLRKSRRRPARLLMSPGLMASILLLAVAPAPAQEFSWQRVYMTGDGPCTNENGPPILEIASSEDGYVYFSTPTTFHRSPDGGLSWESPTFQLYHIEGIASLAADTLLLGLWGTEGGVYRVSNHGDSWELALPGLIRDIALSPDRNVAFASVFERGLTRSDDSGRSWIDVSRGKQVDAVRAAAGGRAFFAISDTIYASVDGVTWQRTDFPGLPVALGLTDTLFAADDDRVYRTIDEGITWSPILDLPNARVLTNAVGAILALGEYGAVWRSDDIGSTWAQLSDGFPIPPCLRGRPAILDVDGHLWAGTDGGMLFRSANSTDTANEPYQPERGFRIDTPFPNPASETVTIRIQIERPTSLHLDMFDALGRRVFQRSPAAFSERHNDYQLDLSALPAGVYIVRVRGDDGHWSSIPLTKR